MNQPLDDDQADHQKLPQFADVQNIISQISSILSNIRAGCAYFSTSSHSNLQSIGNKNIDNTVTIIPITAYLIVFIAGLIFSSFPPERINNSPHHKIKTIESTQAASTKREIKSKKKSQKVMFSANKPPNLDISLSNPVPKDQFTFPLKLEPPAQLIDQLEPDIVTLPLGLNSPGEIELLTAIIYCLQLLTKWYIKS